MNTVLRKEVSGAPAKTGWKTSEFWRTTLFSVGALIAGLAHWLPPVWAAAAIATSEAAYAISRGFTKQGAGIGNVYN